MLSVIDEQTAEYHAQQENHFSYSAIPIVPFQCNPAQRYAEPFTSKTK